MRKSFFYVAKTYLILFIGVVSITSCSSTNSGEDEQEPVGLRVKSEGTTVVEQDATQAIIGSVVLGAGSTSTLTVLFIDEDGAEFTPEPEEHSISVAPESDNVTISSINSDSAPFSFEVTASANDFDSTTITITMNHEGAPEFVSLPLPVRIIAF